jgi:hypothetical protein
MLGRRTSGVPPAVLPAVPFPFDRPVCRWRCPIPILFVVRSIWKKRRYGLILE